MSWMLPPNYLAFDIETIAGEPTEAEEWMRRTWAPNPKWKPATIGSRFLDAYQKKLERLALLDTAPIISLAMRTEADCRVIHWLPIDEQQIAGAALERCADQAAMLYRVQEYLDQCTPETVLIGHNIRHFDLPKIRHAMLRRGVRLPQCLVAHDQPIFDTMMEWNRYTLDERPMISLSDVLDVCGLVNHKQIAEGAMVPELYEQGEYVTILTYAVADVVAEWSLFLRMTGQAGDGSPALQQQARKVMDNSAGNPTPVASAAKVVGRIELPAEADQCEQIRAEIAGDASGGHEVVRRAAEEAVQESPR